MLRLRLARRGRRNLNSFAIVVAEQKFRRDGRFVEKIGYYQPLLKNEDPYRLHIEKERFEYWVNQGAQPSEKILILASKCGIIELPVKTFTSTKKAMPKAKAQERIKAQVELEAAAIAKAEADKEEKKAQEIAAKEAAAAEKEAAKEAAKAPKVEVEIEAKAEISAEAETPAEAEANAEENVAEKSEEVAIAESSDEPAAE